MEIVDILSNKPNMDYKLLASKLTGEIQPLLISAAAEAFAQLFHIPDDAYLTDEGIKGNGPFHSDDLVNLCRKLGLLKTEGELYRMEELEYGGAIPEYKVYAVLGREIQNVFDLVEWVDDFEMEVITQEDFLNILLRGDQPAYSSGDPRIGEHPGLLAFSNMWGEYFGIQGNWPWPSTEAEPAENPYLDDTGWREEHELRSVYGYTVSQQAGLSKKERNRRLTRAIAGLGLRPVVEHIAGRVRLAKARHDTQMNSAIRKWERDLNYLYRIHYRQDFPWPETK